MNCKQRIIQVLRSEDKTTAQLATELFVNKRDVAANLSELHAEGRVYRKWFHPTRTTTHGYRYSTLPFPSRPSYHVVSQELEDLVGEWDTVDMRNVTL